MSAPTADAVLAFLDGVLREQHDPVAMTWKPPTFLAYRDGWTIFRMIKDSEYLTVGGTWEPSPQLAARVTFRTLADAVSAYLAAGGTP